MKLKSINEIVWEFESFDSFFAGLSARDENRSVQLYEKYIQHLLIAQLQERETALIEALEGMKKDDYAEYDKKTYNEAITAAQNLLKE